MNILEKEQLVSKFEQELHHLIHCQHTVHAESFQIKKGHQHAEDGTEYYESLSSSSFKIKHVQSITFGPISSRFWNFRKYLNTVETQNPPFYSWECLTINLKDRDVDLVIKNQGEMDRLVKYLLYRINSIDGNRNSA